MGPANVANQSVAKDVDCHLIPLRSEAFQMTKPCQDNYSPFSSMLRNGFDYSAGI